MQAIGWTLAAVLMLVALPERAAAASIWTLCDGYEPPSARAGVALNHLGLEETSPPKRSQPVLDLSGEAACTQVLAEARIETLPYRKVHVLLRQVMHHLAQSDYAQALAAVDRAAQTLAPLDQMREPGRGLMAMAELMRAFILLRGGQAGEGAQSAARAAAAQPYAFETQLLAARLLAFTPVVEDAELETLNRLVRLSPQDVNWKAEALEWKQDYAQAFELWKARHEKAPPMPATGPFRIDQLERYTTAWRAALSAAAAGMQDEARTWREQAETLEQRLTDTRTFPGLPAPAERESPYAKAFARVEAGPVEPAPLTSGWPLMGVMLRALPEGLQDPWRAHFAQSTLERTDYRIVLHLLPEPEWSDVSGNYLTHDWSEKRKKAPKSVALPANQQRIVYATRSYSLVTSQEVSLLRAAELAVAAGRQRFIIANRQDYGRRTSSGGLDRPPERLGFGVDILIEFLEPDSGAAEQNQHAFEAQSLLDELRPIYAAAPATLPRKTR